MTYPAFTDHQPIATKQAGEFVTLTRDNLMALRDALLAGALVGWNMTIDAGSGTVDQPEFVYIKKLTEWMRGTQTWGTTGGEENNVTAILWDYSADSGVSYDTMGTETMTYDADGNCTAVTWS